MNKKMLYNYLLVIFLLLVSIGIIAGFANLNNTREINLQSLRLTGEASMIYMEQLFQSIDRSLNSEIFSNEHVSQYFKGYIRRDSYYDLYRTYRNAQKILQLDSSIEAAVFYRKVDGLVVSSRSGVAQLEEFGDSILMEEAANDGKTAAWVMHRLENGSLTLLYRKPIPIESARQGYCFVYMDLWDVTERLLESHDFSFSLTISDGDGLDIFTSRETAPDSSSLQNTVYSSYTGWAYTAQMQYPPVTKLLTDFWYVGAAFGVFLLLCCLFLIYTFVKYNIGPVSAISMNLKRYYHEKNISLEAGDKNLMAFIDSAVNELVSEVSDFKDKYAESLIYRRRVFLQELLDDSESLAPEIIGQELDTLQITFPDGPIFLAILEIDRYKVMLREHGSKQLGIYKYMLTSHLQSEMAEGGQPVLSDWIEVSRLCLLLPGSPDHYKAFFSRFLSHVEKTFGMTLTCSLSGEFEGYANVSLEYQTAANNLLFKTTLGSNIIIDPGMITEHSGGSIFSLYPLCEVLSKAVVALDAEWEALLNQLLAAIQSQLLDQGDIVQIIRYFLHATGKKLYTSNESLYDQFELTVSAPFGEVLADSPDIGYIGVRLRDLLREYLAAAASIRERDQYASLIPKIKDYIDEHYADAQLSLATISSLYAINISSFSVQFKKYTGEKFVSYLIGKRVESSIALLADGNLPIGEIAERVGYTNYISFGRAFKKQTGLSPQEYRRTLGQQ